MIRRERYRFVTDNAFCFEVGGRRGHDPSERWSLLPSLGSGPYYNTSGSGYYTVADYREILRYATKLHIEVTLRAVVFDLSLIVTHFSVSR